MKVACLTEFQCALYADGELPALDSREVAAHLEVCAPCRKLAGALREESRVLVECLQSTDFIEFELEDESISAPQLQSLGVARFAAFVLAMSVLLRPVLLLLDQLGLQELLIGVAISATYIVPMAIRFLASVVNNASWIALSGILLLGFVLFSRRSLLVSSILSVLALLTVFTSSSYGLDVRSSDKPITVPSDETVDDTLVVAADSVTIDGTVTGDLIAFAASVTIRGTVKGNVFSFARRVELEGNVEGSVIGFAQSVHTRGHVAHNIYTFTQTVDVAREGRIDENATVFTAESEIEGAIGKDASVFAGSVNVLAPARIGGDLNARVSRSQNVRIEPGATIAGKTDIKTSQPRRSRYVTASFYIWQAIWLLAAFLTGLALLWVFPALSRVTFNNTRDLLVSGGIGCLALIGLPIAAVLAAITLIGLPVGLMALASWLVGIYIAKIVIAEFVGRSLLRNTGDVQPATALVLLVGLIPIFVAINLPFIGGLIHFFLVVLGLGVFAIRTYQMPPWRSAQAA